MKRFVLMAMLLGAMAQNTFAQTDDIYATGEDQSKSASEQTDRKTRRQQRRNNQQSGDPSRFDNGMSNNQYGTSSMPDNYSGGYENGEDYVDYDDDASYSTRLNRFDNDFYNMGYYSAFYNPFWYNRNWYDPYWGYNPWRPGISVSFGYGPYWSSSWGWNSWYGYGAWGSYWNYPSYACGWGGSPWWGWGGGGYYGGGYYNGYWNGYYDGSRYNNGYRNYSYGPRNAGYRTGGGYPYRTANVNQLGLRGTSAGSGVNMYRGTNNGNVGRGWGSRGYSQQYNNSGNRAAQQGAGGGAGARQRGGFWRNLQGASEGNSWGGRSGIAQQPGGTPTYNGGGRASRTWSDGPARQQGSSFGGSRSFGGGNSGGGGGSFGGRGGSSGGGGGSRGGGGRR